MTKYIYRSIYRLYVEYNLSYLRNDIYKGRNLNMNTKMQCKVYKNKISHILLKMEDFIFFPDFVKYVC